MAPKRKNKPNLLMIILFSLIPMMIIIYVILQLVFPSLFQGMPTGEVQPIHPQ